MPEKLLRAAVYARFSTDLQNDRSIDDQFMFCRAHAKRLGLEITEVFADYAVSAATVHGRPEYQRMLQLAMGGRFNVIYTEDLDRLSRSISDLGRLFEETQYAGVKIVTVADGEVNEMHIGLKGTMSAMFLKQLAQKVRRGLAGVIRDGRSAGGRAYGYRPDRASPGRPIIVPEQAEMVLRIFTEYADGKSPKAICRSLTEEGVSPPRGRVWAPSALLGFASRGTGILRNTVYNGYLVWNKVRMVKDPQTGKRVSRPNPVAEWKTVEAPQLRIVSQELFDKVQAQLTARTHAGRDDNMMVHRRPKRLLSGLIKCGACGAGMAVAGVDRSDRTRIRCSAHTNSGACPDPKTFYLDEVEDLVIDSLTKELASPERIYVYAKAFLEKCRTQAVHENHRREEIDARMAAIAKDLQRLMEWALRGLGDETEHLAMQKVLGQERNRLKLELARLAQVDNVVVHPTAVKTFAERLRVASNDPRRSTRGRLEMTLTMLHDMGELSRLARDLIQSVTLSRDKDGAMLMRVESWLEPFLDNAGEGSNANPPSGAVSLVAGEGLEPPTRGL